MGKALSISHSRTRSLFTSLVDLFSPKPLVLCFAPHDNFMIALSRFSGYIGD